MSFLYPLAAFVLVIALCLPAQAMARCAGLVDSPGGRKKHDGTIPLIGGLLIFPVFMLVSFVQGLPPSYIWFFAGLCMLLVTGALDDRFAVAAWVKFLVQFSAAFIIVGPGQAQATNLGDLFGLGDLLTGSGAMAFSVIATVLLINAVNLMDGLDGLAGGMCFIVLSWLAVCCALTGNAQIFVVLLILLSALAGFLVFNLRTPLRDSAAIFLGDAGSLALGLTLAWFSITLSQEPHLAITHIAVAWLLALPIYDTCGQFARRIREGRHPFDADQNHFHHHLIHVGCSVAQATAFILVLTFITGFIGVFAIASGVPEYIMAYIWTALLFGHIYMSMVPERYQRFLRVLLRKADK